MAKFSISLPDSLTGQLDQQVTLQHCGRSKVIQDALSAYLESGGKSKNTRAVSAPEPRVQSPEEHPLHKTVQGHQSQLEEMASHLDSMREAMAEMIRSSGATLSDKLAQMLGKNGAEPAQSATPVAKKATPAAVAVKVPGKRGPKPGAKAAKAAAAAAAAQTQDTPKVRAKPGPKPGSKSAPRAARVAVRPEPVRAKAPEPVPAAPVAASRWQITPKPKK